MDKQKLVYGALFYRPKTKSYVFSTGRAKSAKTFEAIKDYYRQSGFFVTVVFYDPNDDEFQQLRNESQALKVLLNKLQ